MEFSNPVHDSRQFCSLCYFHFWRLTRVFYLGRFEDMVVNPTLALPHPNGKHPDAEAIVLLGDHYYVRYDPNINSMTWQLLVRPEHPREAPRFHPPMEPERTISGWPVFPICRDCFWVTREFLIHRNSVAARRPGITTLDALYAAIYAQWRHTDLGSKRDDQRWQLAWPHRSFRGPFVVYDRWERTAQTTLYTEENTGESTKDWHWLVENPYRPLPSLPEFLLSHLEPTVIAERPNGATTVSHTNGATETTGKQASSNGVSKEAVLGGSSDITASNRNGCELRAAGNTNGTRPESNGNERNAAEAVNGTTASLHNGGPSTWQQPRKTHLLSLPTEILRLIASDLDPATTFNLRLACRRLANALPLDQIFWYHALMTGGLFGFFFDFDSMKVLDETRRRCLKRGRQPPHWDWKRLVGELAQFASFQNGGSMADAPGAFRNRRRIWRILQVAEDVGREDIEGIA